MFYVIEKIYSADGTQIDSGTESEHATEASANARIDYLCEHCQGDATKGENYTRWHVEAER